MPTPILATKLYLPSARPKVVVRSRLLERLNEGLHCRLSLVCAPAGFGKTTLISTWVAACGRRVAWLSLDRQDSDPLRFLSYLVAALQTLETTLGAGVLAALQAPQPPPSEVLLTVLLNDLAALPEPAVLVLDDYHLIEAHAVDEALGFLLEHLPPQLHLLIASREDPNLPLARLRARNQLNELRAADLRFNPAEVSMFFKDVIPLDLAAEDITALECRTEGWIAGLQLAAVSLRGQQDAKSFIRAFSGNHRFVMDYLLEEVLQRQPARVQRFLLYTSMLERFCAALCDALLLEPTPLGQETLTYLEQANLFIVPLDDERRWYRYHHLFADLLRQRLEQRTAAEGASSGESLNSLHLRASAWFEANGLEIDAFHHAAAAHDTERAARLLEGNGMPLPFRGAALPVLHWLESLPKPVLDAKPSLWVMYASVLLFASKLGGVEEKLQAAEAALQGLEHTPETRDHVGHIAAIRATLAVTQHDLDAILTQSRRALDHLHPHNLPVRTATMWTLGYAYQLRGERAAASEAYREAIARGEAIGHRIIIIMASLGLGNIQEADAQLTVAAQTYRRVLELVGDPPLPLACDAHLGLARIYYAWNDLHAAAEHGFRSVELARQLPNTDRAVACELFLVCLNLAQGDLKGAASRLAQAAETVRQHRFFQQYPALAAMQVRLLLHQGQHAAAAQLAQTHDLPASQARVHLAQADSAAALRVLSAWQKQVEAKNWAEEQLEVLVLQTLAHHTQGERGKAAQALSSALTLAEAGGAIRVFLEAADLVAQLLAERALQGQMTDFLEKLRAACEAVVRQNVEHTRPSALPELLESLTPRELEVLQLMAAGHSNQQIGEQLQLALSTVKGHNRNIFGKLLVKRRTEAIARARDVGLL